MGSGQSRFHFGGGGLKVDTAEVFGGRGSGGGGLHLNLLGFVSEILKRFWFLILGRGSSFLL